MKKEPRKMAFETFSKPTIVKTPNGVHSDPQADKITDTWVKTCLYINPELYMFLKVYCARQRISFTKLIDKGLHLVIENDDKLKKAWKKEQQKE